MVDYLQFKHKENGGSERRKETGIFRSCSTELLMVGEVRIERAGSCLGSHLTDGTFTSNLRKAPSVDY